jgi:Rab-GTPase-TBC domain
MHSAALRGAAASFDKLSNTCKLTT